MVVKHTAALAKGLQISQPVIGGVMVKVRSRKHHRGRANRVIANSTSKAGHRPSASIAPNPFVFAPPSTIAQMQDFTAMRPTAPLAPAFTSLKSDHCRKLRPVDWIEPFVLWTDRHRAFQRRDDFTPIGQTRLVRDSRQRGGELFRETHVDLRLIKAAARANEKPPAVKPGVPRSIAFPRYSHVAPIQAERLALPRQEPERAIALPGCSPMQTDAKKSCCRMSREDREIERLRYLLDQHGDRRLNNHRHFLREWRIYRGRTQDELASRIGASSGVIAAWEAGERGIRLQDQFRLFTALRIRPAQFFQWPS
jgi:DNA-binding XRE family transcriptional regulator